MFNVLFAILVTLTPNAQIDIFGGKTYCTIQHTYSGTLDVDYAASYSVTFNTPDGPQTVGYFIVVPAGESGSRIYPKRVPTGWTIAYWDLLSWQPYEN